MSSTHRDAIRRFLIRLRKRASSATEFRTELSKYGNSSRRSSRFGDDPFADAVGTGRKRRRVIMNARMLCTSYMYAVMYAVCRMYVSTYKLRGFLDRPPSRFGSAGNELPTEWPAPQRRTYGTSSLRPSLETGRKLSNNNSCTATSSLILTRQRPSKSSCMDSSFGSNGTTYYASVNDCMNTETYV